LWSDGVIAHSVVAMESIVIGVRMQALDRRAERSKQHSRGIIFHRTVSHLLQSSDIQMKDNDISLYPAVYFLSLPSRR
jgi:hypothetical protein